MTKTDHGKLLSFDLLKASPIGEFKDGFGIVKEVSDLRYSGVACADVTSLDLVED